MLQSVFTTMPMFVTLFWSVILTLHYRDLDRAKRVLTIFMFVAFILYLAHAIYFNHEYRWFPFTDIFYSFATISVYPIYYLYISALTSSRKFTFKNYSILLPAILLSVAISICYLAMSKSTRSEFVLNHLYHNRGADLHLLEKIQILLHSAVKVIFAIQLIPILYIGLQKIKRYDKLVISYYSYSDNKSLYKIKKLLLLFIVTSIVSFIINIVGKVYFINSTYLIIIPSIMFSVLLFAIGYIGTMIEFTIDELSEISITEPTSEEINKEKANYLKFKIIELMEKEKLYLEPNLKISDLTHMMSTNRNYIYNAINVDMGVSFSEFVNRYRVSHAQKLIDDFKDAEMSNIWLRSGFSSEPSFYRNFKLYAGCSPKQWKERVI